MLLLIACDSTDDPRPILEISTERECRANMNALATDQAMHRTNYGRWAVSIDELDIMIGRQWSLSCPKSCDGYINEELEDGYILTCPNGHGSVNTGTRSWTRATP